MLRPSSPEGDRSAQEGLCAGMPGIATSRMRSELFARTAYFDSKVLDATRAGVAQVVVLRAGYDVLRARSTRDAAGQAVAVGGRRHPSRRSRLLRCGLPARRRSRNPRAGWVLALGSLPVRMRRNSRVPGQHRHRAVACRSVPNLAPGKQARRESCDVRAGGPRVSARVGERTPQGRKNRALAHDPAVRGSPEAARTLRVDDARDHDNCRLRSRCPRPGSRVRRLASYEGPVTAPEARTAVVGAGSPPEGSFVIMSSVICLS